MPHEVSLEIALHNHDREHVLRGDSSVDSAQSTGIVGTRFARLDAVDNCIEDWQNVAARWPRSPTVTTLVSAKASALSLPAI